MNGDALRQGLQMVAPFQQADNAALAMGLSDLHHELRQGAEIVRFQPQ